MGGCSDFKERKTNLYQKEALFKNGNIGEKNIINSPSYNSYPKNEIHLNLNNCNSAEFKEQIDENIQTILDRNSNQVKNTKNAKRHTRIIDNNIVYT